MAVIDIKEAQSLNGTHFLHSKANFDTVRDVKRKKAEIAVSAVLNKTGNLTTKSQLNGNSHTPIIAESSNFRKEIGDFVSNDLEDGGFVRLPRSLLKSEIWRNLRLRQQKLFLYILEKAQWKPYVFKYNGQDIQLNPGDLCISYRGLAEDFNSNTRFRDEKIDVPFVQRAVSTFLKSGLTDTRTDTGIMVISVRYPGIYVSKNNETDTPTDTRTIHQRYTNEEQKEREDMKETIDRAIAPDRSFLLDKEKEEEKKPSVFDAPQPSTRKDKNLTDEQKKQYEWLWDYACKNQMAEGTTLKNAKGRQIKGITSQDLVTWLNTRPVKEIVEAMKTTKDANVQTNYPAYLVTLFKKNVVAKKDNIQINDEFLSELMKTHKCLHLENNKQYVTDNIKRTDYQKNSDPKMFKEMIMRSLEMAKDYDQRKSEYSQDREYEEDDY